MTQNMPENQPVSSDTPMPEKTDWFERIGIDCCIAGLILFALMGCILLFRLDGPVGKIAGLCLLLGIVAWFLALVICSIGLIVDYKTKRL